MTTSREMVLVGGVVRKLRDRGSWTSETHIQKTSYIAKIKYGIPFESEFVLYKHGPYSFDLNKSIGHMLGRGLLMTESNAGYGPSFNVSNGLWDALNSGLGNFFAQYSDAISIVSYKVAHKNVSELERLATAIYMSATYPLASGEKKAEMITQVKPHIPYEIALASLSEADAI